MIGTEYKTEKDMKKKKKRSRRKITNVQKRRKIQRSLWIGLLVLVILLLVLLLIVIFKPAWLSGKYAERKGEKIEAVEPEIDVELLTVNPYSRPGQPTNRITGIVMHYTANPGASAIDNRNYFESLKDTHTTQASSNFIIGLEGEIIQCVPTWEVAYASNDRNIDTVSIAWLCMKFDLNEEDIIRHHDVTGKICPKYFVEDEEAWKKFKKDVGATLADFREGKSASVAAKADGLCLWIS